MEYAVRMEHITKYFGKLCANDDVNLEVEKGSIHGIIGENGAGKTTLMKILYGMHSKDSGNIFINEKKVNFNSPNDAIKHRIGMIHQHFTLVPSMSALDNIILGRPPQKHGIVDKETALKEVEDICKRCHWDLNLDEKVQNLPVGLKQRVEIIKAIYLGADVLIMDEPTAVLTPQEITGLFNTLREFKANGTSIIIITHKLSELMEVTDKITVMRNGKVTGCMLTKDTNEIELARKMVGRDVLLSFEKPAVKMDKVLLEVSNLYAKNQDGVTVLDDVSFEVRAGEILGVAGVQGNGQTELVDAITGMTNYYKGKIKICGEAVSPAFTTLQRRTLGLGHIPEDRQTVGSAGDATIEDNYLMTTYRKPQVSRRGVLNRAAAIKLLDTAIEKFQIKSSGNKNYGRSLSGGNMQKLIVAREYDLDPSVLVAAQPTRGVDVGAQEFIYQKLLEMKGKGKAILLVSNELSEIMELSDRIIVMYRGKIVGEVAAEKAERTELGLWMAGITEKAVNEDAI